MPLEQIHPFVIHFPIAFFLSLVVFDFIVTLRNIPLGGRGGVANLSAGLAVLAGIGATIASTFGGAALSIAEARGVSAQITDTHVTFGAVTGTALLIWGIVRGFLWYRQSVIGKTKAWGIVGVELVLSGMLVTTAYFGGMLVYEFGVNVNFPSG